MEKLQEKSFRQTIRINMQKTTQFNIQDENQGLIYHIVFSLCQQFMANLNSRIACIQTTTNHLNQTINNLKQTITNISNEFEKIKLEKIQKQSQIDHVRGEYPQYNEFIQSYNKILNGEFSQSCSKTINEETIGLNKNKNIQNIQSRSLIAASQSQVDLLHNLLLDISNIPETGEIFSNDNSKFLQQKSDISKKEESGQLSKVSEIKLQNQDMVRNHSIFNKQSSSQSISQLNKNSENLDEIQCFFDNIQICDLLINEIIQFGFVLFGKILIGKTCSSHLLSKSPLKGERLNGMNVIDTVTSKNGKCVIGHTINPKTMSPNLFEVQLEESKFKKQKLDTEKIAIIDPPGFRSEKDGVLQIIASGYSNYRIFSKTKNMKFILCFDRVQFGHDTIQTIDQFMKMFKNFDLIKDKVYDSSCFLFNKVEEKPGQLYQPNSNLDDIIKRLKILIKKKINNYNDKEYQSIVDFISQMIKKRKIYTIKSYKNGESTNDFLLINKINSQVKHWFSRLQNLQKNDEVDMKDIQSSIVKNINISTTVNELAQQKLKDFIKFQNEKILLYIGQFQLVITKLIDDVMGQIKSHNYINVMKNFNQKQKTSRMGLEEREREKNRLLSLNSSESTKLSQKTKSNCFQVKKFKVIQTIDQLRKELNNYKEDGIFFIQEFQKTFIKIMKQLQIPSYKNENRKIIVNYGYKLFRLVEESKMFMLLMDHFQPQSKGLNISDPNATMIELFEPLRKFLNQSYKYNGKDYQVSDLQKLFVQKFDMKSEENKNLQVTEDLVDLFTKFDAQTESAKKNVVNIILKYGKKVLSDLANPVAHEILCRLVKNFEIGHNICRDLLEKNTNQTKKNQIIVMMLQVRKNLGNVLKLQKKYQLSMKVYNSVRCIDSVCKLYRQQIDALENSQKSSIKTRIEYIEYLKNNKRKHDAQKVFQQTYQMIELSTDFELIKPIQCELLNFQDLIKLEKEMYHEGFGNLDDISL